MSSSIWAIMSFTVPSYSPVYFSWKQGDSSSMDTFFLTSGEVTAYPSGAP